MKYAFINGKILDGSEDMKPIENKTILTTGCNIEAIIETGEYASDYETIDLQGKYIMPGLVNMHVHLPASGKPKKKQTDAKKAVKLITSNALLKKVGIQICKSYAKTELYSGVTTIRTMGGVEDFDTQIRDMINDGKIAGPRILASNMAVSVEDGHMAGSLAYIAKSAKEAKSYVQKIAENHPDIIKLMITGGVLDAKVKGEPGVLKMPAEFVKAACDEAHRLGLKVAAHVESTEGVKTVLENGVDTIEHGAKLTPEIIELFKARGACHIATLSPAMPYALFDRSVTHISEMEQYNGDIVFKGIISCAKACLENDIPVGLGTDTGCPYITHYDMWRELYYYHQYCGVSNAFALYTATKLNARLAGLGDVTGSIEAGKCADLIVTKDNPLDNLQALRHVDMVVARGQVIHHPEVRKMAAAERELDKFL